MLLNEIIDRAALRRPDHVGLIFAGTEHTYAELAGRAKRLANGLTGITEAGDRVAILADNCTEYLDCIYGCPVAGTTLTMVNQRLTRPEIEFVLADAEPSVLIVGPEHVDRVADIRSAVPSIRQLVLIDGGVTSEGVTGAVPDGMLAYDSLLAGGGPTDLARAHRNAEDIAWLIYTSGTTGRPKGAMLSHRAIISATTNAMIEWRPTVHERNLFCFPLCHVAAFIPLVYHLRGASVVMMKGFDSAYCLALLSEHRITHVGLAPTMLNFILRDPAVETADLDSVSLVVYGGSPMPSPLLEAGIKRFGEVFMGSYGMTELSGNVLVLGFDEHRRAVAGEPELLQAAGRSECLASVRVVDGALCDVAVGEIGEIVVAGDQVMTGYWRADEATKEVLVDGWLRTGDLARVDSEGLFYLIDRKKDMIITGAENVYPKEIEDVLSRCPGVNEVAVLGLPDERWGEAVTAVIVAEQGTDLDLDAVRNFCRDNLAGYKVPKRVVTIDALPRNAAGKVLKRQLRDRLTPT
jgi:acyl-CoA synthetase (AMP-forming)/AMP-acid ligase II